MASSTQAVRQRHREAADRTVRQAERLVVTAGHLAVTLDRLAGIAAAEGSPQRSRRLHSYATRARLEAERARWTLIVRPRAG